MGELDLDSPQMQMTVGELIATVMHLDPTITVALALSEAQNKIALLEDRLKGREALLKVITEERNALMKRNNNI